MSPPAPILPPQAIPQLHGSYYQVQPGETLWGIAHDFGIPIRTLAAVNRLPDPTQVTPGQRLFIPSSSAPDRFLWPARGARTGKESGVSRVQAGLQIRAPEGSFVRASRSGMVAVASQHLAGWGKTVILDHGDGYVTIYAGLQEVLVSPGLQIAQGNPVGRLGQRPLYFEIRSDTRPLDPLKLLP